MKDRRNETYLAVNRNKLIVGGEISSKYMEGFLKLFKDVVDEDFQLKVFFNHVSSLKIEKEFDRII